MESLENKIEILRAKRKCEEKKETERVMIKSCESHDARVSRINNKFLLSQLANGDDYTITSHGIIRKKEDVKVSVTGEGGNGSAAAESDEQEENKSLPDDLGDNRRPCAESKDKHPEEARKDLSASVSGRERSNSQSGDRNNSPSKNPMARRRRPRRVNTTKQTLPRSRVIGQASVRVNVARHGKVQQTIFSQ